jgi:hypothetical protein
VIGGNDRDPCQRTQARVADRAEKIAGAVQERAHRIRPSVLKPRHRRDRIRRRIGLLLCRRSRRQRSSRRLRAAVVCGFLPWAGSASRVRRSATQEKPSTVPPASSLRRRDASAGHPSGPRLERSEANRLWARARRAALGAPPHPGDDPRQRDRPPKPAVVRARSVVGSSPNGMAPPSLVPEAGADRRRSCDPSHTAMRGCEACARADWRRSS